MYIGIIARLRHCVVLIRHKFSMGTIKQLRNYSVLFSPFDMALWLLFFFNRGFIETKEGKFINYIESGSPYYDVVILHVSKHHFFTLFHSCVSCLWLTP